MKTKTYWLLVPALLAAGATHAANPYAVSTVAPYVPATGPVANSGNTSAPANWRLTAGSTFNGIAGAFDGTALLLFTTSEASGTYACSGSLVAQSWVLTAGHCADGLLNMTVQFGFTNNVALQTRTVDSYVQHPAWIAGGGTLDTGSDLTLVHLSTPVTNLPIYGLSTSNDLGKTQILAGYGTSGIGSATTSPNWNDGAYGHYSYNVFETTSEAMLGAIDATYGLGWSLPEYSADTYINDFDFYQGTDAQKTQYNALQRIADATGNHWTSGTDIGATEGIAAGGDSGGGYFIWDEANQRFLLSAVESWGWNDVCGNIGITPTCDYRTGNTSSYGDLAGASAVYGNIGWINSVIGVPEPSTYALMALGLAALGVAARRRA